jgi:glucosamine--fructose-6-phosphate aminotransferase (isomerizing)
LEKLEYRGYDSAGFCVVTNEKKFVIKKVIGGVTNLKKEVASVNVANSNIAIAHTRWATHGNVTVENAQPHTDSSNTVAVAHNGIIENFSELKRSLNGTVFASQTDTEVIAHMIQKAMNDGANFFEAVCKTVRQLKGSFALAITNSKYPNTMIVARNDNPMIVGLGANEFEGSVFVASDSLAISEYIEASIDLNNHEICVIEKSKTLSSYECRFFNFSAETLDKPWTPFKKESYSCDKGNFPDFTSKEISEQPSVILRLINALESEKLSQFSNKMLSREQILFIACGSSLYAGIVGKYLIEKHCNIQTQAEQSSEFRYRSPVLVNNCSYVFISQSGETSDTLKAQAYITEHGLKTEVITNMPRSSMAKKADYVLDLLAGAEFSVVSTKAFTAQLAAICAIVIEFLKQKKVEHAKKLIDDFKTVPLLIQKIIDEVFSTPNNEKKDKITEIVKILSKAKSVLFIGRGENYPVAMECALKLKEISYIHAESYPSGEMKHGSLALIDESVVTVVIAPSDELRDKTFSNMQEIAARGGTIILLTDATGKENVIGQNLATNRLFVYEMPHTGEISKIFAYSVIGQIIAYKVAISKGCNADRPRNLAKSVTVE